MKNTTYIARSMTGRMVASFDTLERAEIFQDNKTCQGVRVEIFEVLTIETPVSAEVRVAA